MASRRKAERVKIEVEEVAYHRNGICGEPFHVVKFKHIESGDEMVGVVFEGDARFPRVAVFDRAKLGEGIIVFGSNSFRGDWYAPALLKAIRAFERRAA